MKAAIGVLLSALLLPFAKAFVPRAAGPQARKSALHDTGGSDGSEKEMRSIDRRSVIAGTLGASLALAFPLAEDQAVAATPDIVTRSVPTWTLQNGGVEFPTLALNTVGLSADETERAIQLAVQEGITHIDFHPGKERDGVAQYLKNNPTGASSLFLNTKIRKAPPGTTAQEAAERVKLQIEEDFKALGVDRVDMLMLRDSPDCDVMQAQWGVLEDALASGKTKSLGIINYCQKSMSCLLETAKIKPDIHYFMLHVGMGTDPRGLRSFGESKGIRTFGYGAVGEPGPNAELLQSPLLAKIGKAHDNRSPEEVALRWVLQSGAAVSVRPTTEFGLGVSACRANDNTCASGMQARAAALDWSLTPREMKQLSALTSPDDNPTLFSSSGCPGAFVMPK